VKKAKKKFDAVLAMREVRDRLSDAVDGMTFEEEKRFIQKQIADSRPQCPRQQARTPPQPMRRRSGARGGSHGQSAFD
jgi:hypothetical protein